MLNNALSILVLLCFCTGSKAQSWVIGDTTLFTRHPVDRLFKPNASAGFDVDCDGVVDFFLQSHAQTDTTKARSRLSIITEAGVEVMRADTGKVAAFSTGDTVPLHDSVRWTAQLDFIFGTGEAGQYGRPRISRKWLAFRKTSSKDTAHLFLAFSNTGLEFTVHEAFSRCKKTPLVSAAAVEEPSATAAVQCSPNPASNYVLLSKWVDGVSIFNSEGKLVVRQKNVHSITNIGHWPEGRYLMVVKDKGRTTVLSFSKQ